MSRLTAKNIIGALSREKVADRLSIDRSAVNKAFADDMMPSSWYAAIKELGEQIGLTIPMSAFRWKSPPIFDDAGDIAIITEYA